MSLDLGDFLPALALRGEGCLIRASLRLASCGCSLGLTYFCEHRGRERAFGQLDVSKQCLRWGLRDAVVQTPRRLPP